MTDLEISKALALAIGWEKSNILPSVIDTEYSQCWLWLGHAWKVFDYRDPAVIWPIAAKFDCFPMRISEGWLAPSPGSDIYNGYCDESPEKAVAMLVINEGKK